MINRISRIAHPLHFIAIFAAVAEVAATIVITQLTSDMKGKL